MKDNIYFISGIDTDCGKTYITGHLARHLKGKGLNVITQKLIQTGDSGVSEDIEEHRRLMGVELYPEDIDGTTCPIIFSFPASPHLAAKIDNRYVDFDLIRQSTKILSGKFDLVLLEGAGGLHVPITEEVKMIDYIKENSYPLILVSSSKLGSINHTLLSIESCFNNGIDLQMVIYNRLPDSDEVIAEDSYRIIQNYLSNKFPDAKMFHSDSLNEIPVSFFS
jgi:dethiobiotin synthetase